mmetsp:Transcript_85347/g.227570  ORF Transcript_85347/g.227570 Transcript_85347/m.227570 type:complete len:180 (-) Transcript_85347:6-545(-)
MDIKNAIESGDVQYAIEKINDLNPELLDTRPKLYFQLKLQHLIELIRSSKVKEALELVQEELAALCEDDPGLLSELEAVLALLAFDPPAGDEAMEAAGGAADEGPMPAEIRRLWDQGQRRATASAVNAAVLEAQGLDREPKLLFLLKMLTWAQDRLGQHASFPRVDDLVAAVPSRCAYA